VPSLAVLALAAAATTAAFDTPLEVHLARDPGGIRAGSVVGDFLVVGAPRPAADGGAIVALRPLALGTLSVPLAGEPATVEVRPSLAPGAAPAAPVFPAAPPLPWWPAAALLPLAAAAWLAFRHARPRSDRDPLGALRTGLAPLTDPSAWAASAGAADRLARACREFLGHRLARPCTAMTSAELGRLLDAALPAPLARPFAAALALADAARFAAIPVRAEDAAALVRELLSAAPAAIAAEQDEAA